MAVHVWGMLNRWTGNVTDRIIPGQIQLNHPVALFNIDVAALCKLSLTSSLLPHWCPSSLLIHVAVLLRQSQGAETCNDLDRDFDFEMTLGYDINSVARSHTSHSSLTHNCKVDTHAHQQEIGKKYLISWMVAYVCGTLNKLYYNQYNSRSNSDGILSHWYGHPVHTLTYFLPASALVSFVPPHSHGHHRSAESRIRNFQWPRLWFRFWNDLSLRWRKQSCHISFTQFTASGLRGWLHTHCTLRKRLDNGQWFHLRLTMISSSWTKVVISQSGVTINITKGDFLYTVKSEEEDPCPRQLYRFLSPFQPWPWLWNKVLLLTLAPRHCLPA